MHTHFYESELSSLFHAGRQTIAAEVKRLLAFNKSVVSNLPICVLIIDLQGCITAVNPAAESMLGYREADLLGRSILVLHDVEELVEGAQRLSKELGRITASPLDVLTSKPMRGMRESASWTYVRCDGGRLPVQVNISAILDENGDNIAFLTSFSDLLDRLQLDEYIQHLAYHDTLTGLPGRHLLRRQIDAAVEQNRATALGFALVMVDLDHFKRLNDSLGHDMGDLALQEIGSRLQKRLRQGDTVARFGGDEFVILLTNTESSEAAEARAADVLEAFRHPLQLGEHKICMTASVGLSFHKESTCDGDLLRNADIALYQSKTLGRNSVSVFTLAMAECRLTSLKMESALREAIDRNEFFLVYQPQICLETGKITGLEALVRWKSAGSGLVMPTSFIPVAEESGLIVEIGAWVLETACREIALLQTEVGYPISVAVNLSPKQVHGEEFQATVEKALACSKLDPSCLELEITEGLLMSHAEEVLNIFKRVQALGITLAIDDFGTGFSNFSYITRFQVDRLKIDRSFVSRCLTDRNSMAVTTAIVALAQSLGLKIVAEGVETAEQAALLRSLHCDSAQGYLYAAPLSIAEVRLLVRSRKFVRDLPQTETPPPRHLVQTRKVITDAAQKQKNGWAWGTRTNAALKSYNPFEPRDPVSRPASPQRIPGAARPVLTMSKDEF